MRTAGATAAGPQQSWERFAQTFAGAEVRQITVAGPESVDAAIGGLHESMAALPPPLPPPPPPMAVPCSFAGARFFLRLAGVFQLPRPVEGQSKQGCDESNALRK